MKNIKDIRIGIIGTEFRENITIELEKSCVATLRKKGLSNAQIKMVRVPGALEIPLIAKKMAKQGKYDAIIVFGAIIKGKTYHFEQVANECVRGCMQVAYDFEIPVVFEVLSVYDIKDALDRALGKKDNRGGEGALTALSMIRCMNTII